MPKHMKTIYETYFIFLDWENNVRENYTEFREDLMGLIKEYWWETDEGAAELRKIYEEIK